MLQPTELLYAEARVKGLGPEMAAIAAGYAHCEALSVSEELEKNHLIQKFIAENVAVVVSSKEIASKIDPLEFLEAKLQDDQLDIDTRIKIAHQLLPYKHKKVANPPSKQTKKEVTEERLKEAEGGNFGAARPPRTVLRAIN